MSAVDFFSMATSSGVLAGGLGILTWAMRTETRIIRLELKAGIGRR